MKILLILSLAYVTSALAAPCGQTGTIDERIKECNFVKGNFVLVARDDKGLEVYKDLKSNLIWGDRITSDFNHYGSQMACNTDLPEAQILKDVHWRLPTVHEFEVAASHGMKADLPHMNHGFWSSTPVRQKRRRSKIPSQVFIWDGMSERTDTGDLKEGASVRCIGTDHKKS